MEKKEKIEDKAKSREAGSPDASEEASKEEISALEPKAYELGYLLVPTIAMDKIGEETDKLTSMLEKLKTASVSLGTPQLIDLAYEIEKTIGNKKQIFKKAYFGWIRFELDPPSLLALKEELDQNDNVVRYLLIKTTREELIPVKRRSTIKKAAPKKAEVKRVKEETKPLSETEKAEIDKKIEQLVTE